MSVEYDSVHFLEQEWSETNSLSFAEALLKSLKSEYWWQCNSGKYVKHEYQLSLFNRIRGRKCNVCAGKRITPGVNDLASHYPEVLAFWDYKKNIMAPTEVSSGSSKLFSWVCEKGHSWEAKGYEVCVRGTRCPYCANQKLLVGYNDLATSTPHLAEEWSYDKNFPLTPEQVIRGSNKKYYWVCTQGHQWFVSPNARENSGCPICGKKSAALLQRKPKPGKSLKDIAPYLENMWSLKNETKFNDVSYGSSVPYLWVCEQGHETYSLPKDRVRGHGCNKCYTYVPVSEAEKELVAYIREVDSRLTVTSTRRDIIEPFEVDIYVEELSLAVEFNGSYWHSSKFKNSNYHYEKWLACRNKNVSLLNVWEDEWVSNPVEIKRGIEDLILNRTPVGYKTGEKVTVSNGSINQVWCEILKMTPIQLLPPRVRNTIKSAGETYQIYDAGSTVYIQS